MLNQRLVITAVAGQASSPTEDEDENDDEDDKNELELWNGLSENEREDNHIEPRGPLGTWRAR
jgi:hypothetical protein